MSAALAFPLPAAAPATLDDLWLTREMVLRLTDWKDRWLRKKAEGGSVTSKLVEDQRHSNGRAVRMYLATSLPESAQRRYLARFPRRAPAAFPGDAPPSTTALLQMNAAPARVPSPTTTESALAAERFSKIELLLTYESDPERCHALHLVLNDGTRVDSKSRLARYLAEIHGVSEASIWNWLKRAKTDSLARRRRSDQGQSRWAVAHPRAAQLAAHVYLGDGSQPGQSAWACWEAVRDHAATLGLQPADLPSYETVRSFLHTLNPALRTLAREGRRAYDETFAPYVRRGYTDVAANEIWVSDHMIHDVFVQNDCFGRCDRGHMRLRFTALMDFRSRLVVGAAWSEEGSSRSITNALRHAVTRFGPARLLYCDNGKDYQKVAKGGRRDEIEQAPALLADLDLLRTQGVFARLGIETLHCIKFHPQSKHVERMFRTVHERFDKLFTTYCGAASHLRPDAATAALERHGKLLRDGRPQDSPLPLASEFIRMAMHWLSQDYAQTPQSGKGIDGLTPAECFAQARWAGQPSKPAPEVLALLLADRATRKVRECAVELGGARYIPADAWSSARMLSLTTREVTVAYDANDSDAAVALDADGHILAYLQRERLLGMYQGSADPRLAAETQAAIAGSMQERKRLVRGLTDSRDALARQVRAAGYTPKVDALYAAAMANAVPAVQPVAEVLAHRPLRASKPLTANKPIYAHDIAAAFLAGEND